MHKLSPFGLSCCLLICGVCAPPQELAAQQSETHSEPKQASVQETSPQPIGRTSATEVRVAGAVDMHAGEMLLGNGSTVTAGSQSVKVALTRGGQLQLCSTTSLHLAKDRSIADPQNTALMMALDRGALETDYNVGRYSDVLLTPDLRILISGPGEAKLKIRLNAQGDTCVDNPGVNAPYVTVSSQLEGGAYRVMPNQRVSFEHGSIKDVIDHETEPCGCPQAPAVSVAEAGISSAKAADPGQPVGGPSSTPADTAFPLAESEGLAPPPAPPSQPVVPVGVAHAQVTIPLSYNGENPPPAAAPAPSAAKSGSAAASSPAALSPTASNVANVSATVAAAPASPTPRKPNQPHGVFHRIGRFFSRLFGA